MRSWETGAWHGAPGKHIIMPAHMFLSRFFEVCEFVLMDGKCTWLYLSTFCGVMFFRFCSVGCLLVKVSVVSPSSRCGRRCAGICDMARVARGHRVKRGERGS